MQILTEIGEIGVHYEDKTYILRPSFYAMSKLGSPEEILHVYAEVMSEKRSKYQDQLALGVLYACHDGSEDISHVFGCSDAGEEVKGICDKGHILPLARALMQDGITGSLPPLPKKPNDEPEYMKEFVARDFVAMAMAHLGLSERDSWNLTMTSFVAALRSKFPPIDGPNASKSPTAEKTKETLDWFNRIKAKKNKQGVH